MKSEPISAKTLIALAVKAGASDVAITPGFPPFMLVHGTPVVADSVAALGNDDVLRIVAEMKALGAGHDYDGTTARGFSDWPRHAEEGIYLRLAKTPAQKTPASGQEA